jgi:ABC-2 type transport system ATP-binding protein
VNAIITSNLTKKFDKLTAVNRVSFHVDQGEIFGLLGPNGAGKTTIIKMLSTLISPTDGSASVWGHSVIENKDAVRRSIGMVFQDTAVDDMLTGRENLDFHARMYGMKSETRKERIKSVLNLVGLEDKANVLLKNYSGGMKRRLEIARGLMHFPRVLFLDEPTLGLDPQTRYHIWEYIKELNMKENVTIILTTHYMEEADSLCSRIGIIDYVKILVVDTPEALKNSMGNDLLTIKASNLDPLIAAFSEKEWVKEVKKYDSCIVASVQHGEEKVPLVVSIAQALNISITAISVRKPTLEDVFLHYTGKTIRDEEANGTDQARTRTLRKRRAHP